MSPVRAILLLAALAATSCASSTQWPPPGEIDNPQSFRVLALLDDDTRYDRFDAELFCSSKVYCDRTPPGPDCYCERYKLRSADFSFEWSLEASTGAHLGTDAGNVIVRDGDGTLARGELTITQKGRAYVTGGFYYDFAGTFAVQTERHTFTRGVFYAFGP